MGVSRAELIDSGTAVRLTWDDGFSARFHAIWLRDNALDEATRDAGNGQRKISLADIRPDITIQVAEATPAGLELVFAPEDHAAVFPGDWLRARVYDRQEQRDHVPDGLTLWGAGHELCAASLALLESNRTALRDWLAAVRRDGVARVADLPCESGSLERIVGLFGHIRETNYGRWFEVRSEVNPINLAYTNLGLQAHTDNPYRDPVPGLQILACLENSVVGGESTVVDGFAVADQLRREDPAAFDILADYPARFEYAGTRGMRLTAKRPIIETGPDGELIAIRFNNRSLAPVTDIPYEAMEAWYAALRRFGELIDAPRNAVQFRLDPGAAFIVDNTRVLHARSAFSSSGRRWLQGCYADKDGLLSTLAALEAA